MTTTPTPQEDSVLLREAATIHWESTPPGAVQSQWQAVAHRVALSTGTRVRSPDDVKRRFHTLMAMAEAARKAQAPGGQQAPPRLRTMPSKQPPTQVVREGAEKGATPEPVATQPVAPVAPPAPVTPPAPVATPAPMAPPVPVAMSVPVPTPISIPVATPAPASPTQPKVTSRPKRQRTDSSTPTKPSASPTVVTPSLSMSMFENTSRVAAMYSAQWIAAMNAKQAIAMRQTIPEYQDEIAELKSMVRDLMTVVRHAKDENTELTEQVRGLHKSYRTMELVKIEIRCLRTEVEETRKELAAAKSQAETHSAQVARIQQVQDMQVVAIELLKKQHPMPQARTTSVIAATSCGETQGKIEQRLTEWKAAETVKWDEFVSGVKGDRAKFEGELRAAVEQVSASLTADISRVRESVESCCKSVEGLAKKHEENENAERQRQAIFFEMVESETQKREEQTTDIEKRLSQCEISHTELATTVEKRWTKDDTKSQEREESLLWFQEEIQRELRSLQDQVLVEMSKYEDRLSEFENGQGDRLVQELQDKVMEEVGKQIRRVSAVQEDVKTLREIFDEKITAIEEEQSETKRLWMDQYVRSTVQLHDIRSAIDKERHDRSQEFATLLQNVQGMVSNKR